MEGRLKYNLDPKQLRNCQVPEVQEEDEALETHSSGEGVHR